jgi:antirestriction protein ArdC
MTTRIDLYTRVTDRLIADLERGVRPWMKPWNAEHAAGRITRPLRHNGQPYRGINVLLLWLEAESKNYSAPLWLTFKQARELGGFVRKDERGSPVIYSSSFTRKQETEDGSEAEQAIRFLKEYAVFNAEQVEGLPPPFYASAAPPLDLARRIEAADRFFAQTGADIRHGGNQAYYACEADYVQMPPFVAFTDAESYYSTLGHEKIHWTKHPNRLAREFGRKTFGGEGYAREELVAEIGAAFLCCDLGITPEAREDHAAYLDYWLKVLKEDKKAVFTAAAQAQRAVDFLHGLQPGRPQAKPNEQGGQP